MPDTLEYDQIIEGANRIGSQIRESEIVGISLPVDFKRALINPQHAHSSNNCPPFSGSMVTGSYRILILPDGPPNSRKQAIRILKQIKAASLILVITCMGLRHPFSLGRFVSIEDHINLSLANPLSGPNDERIGTRYPNMCHPYDQIWSEKSDRAARALGIHLQKAVYASVQQPPSPSEQRILSTIGADVVGHGVADEVIIANHCGLPVTAIGFIDANAAAERTETQAFGTPRKSLTQHDAISQILNRMFDKE